jgi:hypothetical protein
MKKMTKKKTFWLSYDLGLKGDYNSLYGWLDKMKARECGDSFAVFQFTCKTDNPKDEIKKELESEVKFNKNDRVYLIWRDDVKQSNAGGFIIGNRKSAPWEGYFSTGMEQTIDY